MRIRCLALTAILLYANAANAQFLPAFGPGPIQNFGYAWHRAYYSAYPRITYLGQTCWASPWSGPAVTIVVRSPNLVSLAQDREIPSIRPVPPSERHEGVLAIRPNPAGIKNLPPPRLGADPAMERVAEPERVAPPPAANARTEAKRQVQLGLDAFARGEFGRARERFSRAVALRDDHPTVRFLIAQAELTLGRYAEATAAIIAGMKLNPNWPRSDFNPRLLYGTHDADFLLDLERLREQAQRVPQDPAILFLYAYQLWFNGRKSEARPLFEKVLALIDDPTPVRQFLP